MLCLPAAILQAVVSISLHGTKMAAICESYKFFLQSASNEECERLVQFTSPGMVCCLVLEQGIFCLVQALACMSQRPVYALICVHKGFLFVFLLSQVQCNCYILTYIVTQSLPV